MMLWTILLGVAALVVLGWGLIESERPDPQHGIDSFDVAPPVGLDSFDATGPPQDFDG
jgi:hypothetical protein